MTKKERDAVAAELRELYIWAEPRAVHIKDLLNHLRTRIDELEAASRKESEA